MAPRRTILISSAGTGTSFALGVRLRAHWADGVRLVSADTNPAHLVTLSVLSDEHVRLPPASHPEFSKSLLAILSDQDVTTYIPIQNAEIVQSAKLLSVLHGVDLWSSELYASLCSDKAAIVEWLNSIGLPTPRTIGPAERGPQLIFVKPRDAVGSRDARVMTCDDLQRLEPAVREQLIAQELCQLPEVTIDSFYDVESGAVRAIARERIETKDGVCTKAKVFENPVFTEYARVIGEGLHQCGVICFQVMRSNEGWVITDLNLRSGAGTAMTCAVGVDLLAAAFACRWKEDFRRFLRSEIAPEGVFVTRQYAEFVMTAFDR